MPAASWKNFFPVVLTLRGRRGPITISYPIFLIFGFILVEDSYIRIVLINRHLIYSLSYIRMNNFKIEINHKFLILVDIEYNDVYCTLYRMNDYEYELIQKKSFKKEFRNEIECLKTAYEIFSDFTILIND